MRKVFVVGALAAVMALPATFQSAMAVGPSRTAAPMVRPGMVINITLPQGPAGQPGPFENSCTAGFVFSAKSPTAPRRQVTYLATAGHCLLSDQTATEEVHRDGRGPVVTLTAINVQGVAVPGPRLGQVVYTAASDPVQYPDPNLPDYMDLGLIRLDDNVIADPALCLFGGPTGLRTEPVDVPEPFRFYGAGNATGFNRETGQTLLPGRTALGSTAAHPHLVTGAFAISSGDSGSAIIDSAGRAVASVTGPYQPRINVMLPRIERVLGVRLTLRTAPLRQDVPAAGTDAGCAPPSTK